MKEIDPPLLSESMQPPLYVRQFSPQMIAILEKHFWCDFSDIVPAMKWDKETPSN